MTQIEIWLLAFALAVDCFAVSTVSGIAGCAACSKYALRTAVLFGVFQGGMPVLGWLGMSAAADVLAKVDHWIAFGLLAIVGGKMIHEGLHPEQKSANIRNLGVVILLAIATSIDALAVGVSFRCVGWKEWTDILPAVLIIAGVAFTMSMVGFKCGTAIGKRIRGGGMEMVGGAVLIGIGIKILIEHGILA